MGLVEGREKERVGGGVIFVGRFVSASGHSEVGGQLTKMVCTPVLVDFILSTSLTRPSLASESCNLSESVCSSHAPL